MSLYIYFMSLCTPPKLQSFETGTAAVLNRIITDYTPTSSVDYTETPYHAIFNFSNLHFEIENQSQTHSSNYYDIN